MKLGEIDRYEIAAEAFRRMTGMMAPGKAEPVAGGASEFTPERRAEAWHYWNHHHGRLVTALLNAACEVLPDESEPDDSPSSEEEPRIYTASDLAAACREAREEGYSQGAADEREND